MDVAQYEEIKMTQRTKAIYEDIKIYIRENCQWIKVGAISNKKQFASVNGLPFYFQVELRKEDAKDEYGAIRLIKEINNGDNCKTFAVKVNGEFIAIIDCSDGRYSLIAEVDDIVKVNFTFSVFSISNFKE